MILAIPKVFYLKLSSVLLDLEEKRLKIEVKHISSFNGLLYLIYVLNWLFVCQDLPRKKSGLPGGP